MAKATTGKKKVFRKKEKKNVPAGMRTLQISHTMIDTIEIIVIWRK